MRELDVTATAQDGKVKTFSQRASVRASRTRVRVEYYEHGGILQYVLPSSLAATYHLRWGSRSFVPASSGQLRSRVA